MRPLDEAELLHCWQVQMKYGQGVTSFAEKQHVAKCGWLVAVEAGPEESLLLHYRFGQMLECWG